LSLHLPDFPSGERTFQLITQVSGRAGRGDIEGEVFVQSFTPFHPAIQYARRHDFEGFYEQEAEFRQQLGYPPFGRMAILLVRGLDEDRISDLALDIRKNLEHLLDGFPGLTIAGPAPAPLLKAEDEFRYQLMLRVKNMTRLSHYLAEWVSAYKMPPKCRLTIDIDPIFTA
jgi:primosomal protein N' (replication factor Y) (superfamily II helicase)